MGFSAEQVLAQLPDASWTVAWAPEFDAPFDALQTTLTRATHDIRRQRPVGFGCTSTEDYMNVPVTVDLVSDDSSFSATLTGSALATSLALDDIQVATQGDDPVTDAPDSTQAEWDAAIDAQDPWVKEIRAVMGDPWSAPQLDIEGYAEANNGTTVMTLARGTLSPTD